MHKGLVTKCTNLILVKLLDMPTKVVSEALRDLDF